MSDKITPAQAFQFVRAAVSQDASLVSAIIEGITQGQKDRLEEVRDRLLWSEQSLVAAMILLNAKRITPGLAKHLEFCIAKHFEADKSAPPAVTEFLERVRS